MLPCRATSSTAGGHLLLLHDVGTLGERCLAQGNVLRRQRVRASRSSTGEDGRRSGSGDADMTPADLSEGPLGGGESGSGRRLRRATNWGGSRSPGVLGGCHPHRIWKDTGQPAPGKVEGDGLRSTTSERTPCCDVAGESPDGRFRDSARPTPSVSTAPCPASLGLPLAPGTRERWRGAWPRGSAWTVTGLDPRNGTPLEGWLRGHGQKNRAERAAARPSCTGALSACTGRTGTTGCGCRFGDCHADLGRVLALASSVALSQAGEALPERRNPDERSICTGAGIFQVAAGREAGSSSSGS